MCIDLTLTLPIFPFLFPKDGNASDIDHILLDPDQDPFSTHGSRFEFTSINFLNLDRFSHMDPKVLDLDPNSSDQTYLWVESGSTFNVFFSFKQYYFVLVFTKKSKLSVQPIMKNIF